MQVKEIISLQGTGAEPCRVWAEPTCSDSQKQNKVLRPTAAAVFGTMWASSPTNGDKVTVLAVKSFALQNAIYVYGVRYACYASE